MVIWG